jgi:aldehyde dehydrogenase (NAD+)
LIYLDRLLIDGELVHAEGRASYENINPATEDVLGVAADASRADISRAITAARRAFDTSGWATDLDFRVRCLRQLHGALVEHSGELRQITVSEVGAPVMLTAGPQVDLPIELVRYYADVAATYGWREDLGVLEAMGGRSRRWIEREGAGVVGAITPWNFPTQIALAKTAPALAAGCAVVLKVAPDTPWSGSFLGSLVAQHTDIPPGVFNVITSSDKEVGEVLTTSPDVDLISFTGSTATGRRIMAAASETVKRLFLELGGKSAFVVLDDADLAAVLPAAAFRACFHAGQGCAITTRLLLPRSRYDEGVEIVRQSMASMPYGDPTQPGNIMGPLISAAQRERVDGYVRIAVDEGATLVAGGKCPDQFDRGWFYEPTLLAGVEPHHTVAQEEVFGPVLAAIAFDDEDHAVQIVNGTIFGLSGAVFSSDRDRAVRFARRVRSGTISVNGGNYYGEDAPFGGYKQSGIGREMGIQGFEEYLQSKTLAEPAVADA